MRNMLSGKRIGCLHDHSFLDITHPTLTLASLGLHLENSQYTYPVHCALAKSPPRTPSGLSHSVCSHPPSLYFPRCPFEPRLLVLCSPCNTQRLRIIPLVALLCFMHCDTSLSLYFICFLLLLQCGLKKKGGEQDSVISHLQPGGSGGGLGGGDNQVPRISYE